MLHQAIGHTHPQTGARADRVGMEWLTGLRETYREWQRRWRYRQDLRRLLAVGPYLIRDIGLTTGEAESEATKPFWTA